MSKVGSANYDTGSDSFSYSSYNNPNNGTFFKSSIKILENIKYRNNIGISEDETKGIIVCVI